MTLAQPFLILATLCLAWAIVPPTLFWLLARSRRKVRASETRHWFAAYGFLSIALGWSTLFLFYPLAISFVYAFTDKSLSVGSELRWVGLRNFETILFDPFWWRSLWVTVLFILGTLPYSIFVSLFLASLIVGLPPRWQTFFKAALYVPGVTGLVVQAAIMRWVFHPGDGFANIVLNTLGIVGGNVNWFGEPTLALPTIIVMSWLTVNGLAVIIYCAALGGIPRDYYEAAEIDGATWWGRFRHVTWPLSRPSTVYVVITGLIAGFQVFAPALLITGGGPQYTTNFVNYSIYRTFFYTNQFGLACAMCVVLMLVIVGASAASYRFLRSEVEY